MPGRPLEGQKEIDSFFGEHEELMKGLHAATVVSRGNIPEHYRHITVIVI